MMLVDRRADRSGAEREGKLDRVEFVHDGTGTVPDVDAVVTPGWMGEAVRPAGDADVAVLLVDTRRGVVTYANPAALALSGDRAQLPVEAAAWTKAARLVLPGGGQPDGLNALPIVDPVAVVAAGGTVPGMRIEIADDEGRQLPYWVTGSQLLTAAGVAGTRAIVALFPVHALHDGREDRLARAPRLPHPAGPGERGEPGEPGVLAGADGAAIARADAVARSAVADEALRKGTGAVAETGLARCDIDELTARALVASSVSFTISDPRRPDDPLVWVNPAFERMTGYAASEIVGRNCRFLQGPGTDRDAVQRLREALQRGEAVRAELLNYRKDGTPFWNAFTISPVVDGDNQLTHFVGVQTDITARVIAGMEYERLLTAEREARALAERAKSRLDVMVDVGALLSGTLDADEAMRRLAGALVPRFADFCIVDLVGRGDDTAPTGAVAPADPVQAAAAMLRRGRRVAAVHRDEELGALLARLSPDPAGESGKGLGAQALATSEVLHLTGLGEEDWVTWAGDDPELATLGRRLATHAVIVAPMRARGRVVGALTLGQAHSSGRAFDDADLGLGRTLAARAALAVDNAMLFEAESAQRRRADALAAAGTALAASGLHSSEAVTVLLDHVVPAMGALALVHADEKSSPALRAGDTSPGLRLVASRATDADVGVRAVDLFGRDPLTERTPGPGQAWSTGVPQILPVDLEPDQREGMGPLLGGQLVCVPLTVRATTFGTLTVVRPPGATFTGDEVRYLAELARRAALTLDNARLYENERLVALELQRSLLPARLPRIAELDVAGRYLAGAAGTEVGGDWYDVIPLPGGRVAVAVGDVMGRGVHAAAVMGQMRAALRSYAVEGLDAPELLAHLAAFAQVLEGDHLVTCLVGIHDAASGTVTFASAGHPPPLRLGADGDVGYVDVPPGLPLGVPSTLERGTEEGAPPYPETSVKLTQGSTLLLFTDGLVEDRDVPVATGLRQLADAFEGRLPATAEDACSEALRTMGRDTSHDDDTAVLALRATNLAEGNGPGLGLPRAGDPLEVSRVELQASPHAPAAARRAVAARLTEAGLADQVDTATLLVSEVVTNALRHGGGPEELLVEIDAEGVSIGVRDSSLQAPRKDAAQGPGAVRIVGGSLAENGRGLLLVDMLADSWGWRPESTGKLVWFRLERDGGAG
jgi:PAS domain S-box-containing protein